MDLIPITVVDGVDKLPVHPTRRSTETWMGGEYVIVREVGTRTVWAECPLCGDETNSRGTNGPGYEAVRDMATQHLYDWHRETLTFPTA